MNLERLHAMVRKEFVQMRRDPATLRLMLAVPVMQLLIFGFAIRTDVRHLPTVVFDQSRTQQSREFVQRLTSTDNFVVRRQVLSYAEAIEAVDAGEARAAVVLPPDYARNLKRGQTARVQVLVDASDPAASQNAIGAAQLVGQRLNVCDDGRIRRGVFEWNQNRLVHRRPPVPRVSPRATPRSSRRADTRSAQRLQW